MAKRAQQRSAIERIDIEEVDEFEPTETTSDPGLGLETSPNHAGTTAPTETPPIAEQLPDKRVKYPSKKEGEFVESLSKADLNQRSLKQILAVCPVHKTACVSTSTSGFYTHLGCPVKGCKFRIKVVRPTVAQKLNRLPPPQRDITRGKFPG